MSERRGKQGRNIVRARHKGAHHTGQPSLRVGRRAKVQDSLRLRCVRVPHAVLHAALRIGASALTELLRSLAVKEKHVRTLYQILPAFQPAVTDLRLHRSAGGDAVPTRRSQVRILSTAI